jgi:hypothetical protein
MGLGCSLEYYCLTPPLLLDSTATANLILEERGCRSQLGGSACPPPHHHPPTHTRALADESHNKYQTSSFPLLAARGYRRPSPCHSDWEYHADRHRRVSPTSKAGRSWKSERSIRYSSPICPRFQNVYRHVLWVERRPTTGGVVSLSCYSVVFVSFSTERRLPLQVFRNIPQRNR